MKLRIALICFMIITTFSLSSACKKTETKFKIEFGTVGNDHWDISNVKLYYNADALGKKVPEKRGVVYMAFKTVNYEAIAEQFGFDVAHLYPSVDDTVEYYDESDLLKRRLLIRPNGIICYETGVAQTAFESKVSKDDCVELTKKVLKEYKLTDHSFDDECFFSERLLTDPSNNETKIVGYTVFLYFLLNGVKLYGEPRATVQFNGNGEVVSIMYNMPDYYEAGECELIRLFCHRTLQGGKSAVSHSSSGQLIISGVSRYWSVSKKHCAYAFMQISLTPFHGLGLPETVLSHDFESIEESLVISYLQTYNIFVECSHDSNLNSMYNKSK